MNKGEKSVYSLCKSDEECYTALIGENAAGQLLPKMILFNNQRISAQISNNFPEDFVVGKNDSG